MKTAVFAMLWIIIALLNPTVCRGASCVAPSNGSVVAVSGHPFGMAVSRDGCWMFISATAGEDRGRVVVLHDIDGTYSVERTVALRHDGAGVALTHDGRLLVVAADTEIAVFSVHALEAAGDPRLGTLTDGSQVGAAYVISSLNDDQLFVSEENAGRLAVFDLAKWRADDYKGNPLIGHIPTGVSPVGLALSPDGRWLYSTSETTAPDRGFEQSCRPETSAERWHPQGVVLRINIASTARDPLRSVSGLIQAGCNPVRVAVSRDGAYLWVTARNSGALLRVATSDFGRSNSAVNVTSFRLGGAPVGVAVRPDGKQVWVALSDRFADKSKEGDKGRQLLGLIGAGNIQTASIEMVSEPAFDFPRELCFLPDGRSLAVGLYQASRIEFFTTPQQ